MLEEAQLLSDALISNPKGTGISSKESRLMKTKMNNFEQKEDNLKKLFSMQNYDVSTEIGNDQINAVPSFTNLFTDSFTKEIKNTDFGVGHELLLMPIFPITDPFSPKNDVFNFEEDDNQLDPLSPSFFLKPILIDNKVDINKTYNQSRTICSFTHPFNIYEFNVTTSKEYSQLRTISPCNDFYNPFE